MHVYRLFAHEGGDIGLIEHERDELRAGDVLLDPNGQLVVVES